MYSTIVTTEVVAAHLDGSWAIVDCRFDLQDDAWGERAYLTAHIPGAVYAHLNRDLSGRPTGSNGRHPLPDTASAARFFGSIGISAGRQVVAYDQDAGMYAARLWWLLRYLGHDSVAVLDGGWGRWTAEGRPTRSGREEAAPARFQPEVRSDLMATLDEVAIASREGNRRLVDARAPDRFQGQNETIDPVAGHIPGAVNHFFRRNVTPQGTFLPPDALRHEYERLVGPDGPGRTIVYCGSGVTACHNLLAMEHSGLRGARLYPGSWSEWCSDPSRGVATGE